MGADSFGIKARRATAFDIVGKLPDFRFRCHRAAFATCQRCFRLIDGHEDFESSSLALFPQRKRLLHRIFLALKPSALNGLADKRFLIGGELDFHTISAQGATDYLSSVPLQAVQSGNQCVHDGTASP